jgi:hypothetical protein
MWEPKLDGYRVLAFIDSHGVSLRRGAGSSSPPHFRKSSPSSASSRSTE